MKFSVPIQWIAKTYQNNDIKTQQLFIGVSYQKHTNNLFNNNYHFPLNGNINIIYAELIHERAQTVYPRPRWATIR